MLGCASDIILRVLSFYFMVRIVELWSSYFFGMHLPFQFLFYCITCYSRVETMLTELTPFIQLFNSCTANRMIVLLEPAVYGREYCSGALIYVTITNLRIHNISVGN